MTIQNKNSIVNAAAIVMSGLVLSRITGFVRQMLVPSLIGSNYIGDSYSFSFRITELVFYLLIGGAISAALVPVLTGYITKGEEKEGWKAVSTFINFFAIAMVIVTIICVIFAPYIVPMLAIGYNFDADRQKIILVTELSRILFPSVGILMLVGMSFGVLNSYKRFAAAAFGPSVYNILSCLSIIFLNRISIHAVAWGVVGSSLIYFLLQLVFVRKNLQGNYLFKLYLRHPGFVRLFKLAIPSLIASSIAQVNTFISSMFTTLYPSGTVVAQTTADRIWQTPYGIFAQGIGTALLPAMSEKYATGENKEYKNILIKGFKTVLLLAIPSAVGLIVLSSPLISFFKLSDKYDPASMLATRQILISYTLALISVSSVAILIRGFYAINDTKTPLFAGIVTIIINISLNYTFYKFSIAGVSAMPLSYSIANTVYAFILLFVLNKKINGIGLKKLVIDMIKIISASLIMAGAVYISKIFFRTDISQLDFETASSIDIIAFKVIEFSLLMINIIIGVLVYFGFVLIFKVEEGQYALKTFKEKLSGLKKRLTT